MSLEIDLPPSVVAPSAAPARPTLRLVEPPRERRARAFAPAPAVLAALVALALALAAACAVALTRRRRGDAPRSSTVADVAAARAALALEERRRALEDRPVIRFVDDLAPAVPAPVASSLQATAVRASLGGGLAAGTARGLDSAGDARAVVWAAASILSLGIAMLVLTGAFAAPSILGATVPTAVGIGALLRYAMLSTRSASRRDDWRPRPR